MSLETHERLLPVHADTIIGNPHQTLAATAHLDRYLGAPGIERILKKLFYD